jgi:putative transposase
MPSHLRRYDEPGHVHFWTISAYRRLGFFHDENARRILIGGLRLLQSRHGVCLIGYVLMPEHIHVLLYPHASGSNEPVPISTLLLTFKQYTGAQIKAMLRTVWRNHGQLWSPPLNAWAKGHYGEQRPIWTPRGYDSNVKTHDALLTKLEYCHKNPITRRLVERAAEWPWSSYRFYEFQDASVLPMNWDGSWPIIW